MFETVLVANRGEIARRIIRTVQRMGLKAVAVHSEADVKLPYVREADESVAIGPASPAQSYRDVEVLLEAARQTGAEAVHPRHLQSLERERALGVHHALGRAARSRREQHDGACRRVGPALLNRWTHGEVVE